MNHADFIAECDRLAAEGLQNAISDATNRNRLAVAVGLTRAAVGYWKAVPLVHVPVLCRLFGKPPTRYRPDVFAAPRLLRELAKTHV